MSSFAKIGDDALVASLLQLVGSHRKVMSEILRHLAEVEERRIHLRRGFGSLFEYCVDVLGFSEDEACRRIDAARMGRYFPVVFSMVTEGAVTLSVLGLLRPRINAENANELLRGARGLTVRRAKEWLARLFPSADVPDSVRKLPKSSKPLAPTNALAEAAQGPRTVTGSVPSAGTTQLPESRLPVTVAPAPLSAASAPRREIIEPVSGERFSLKVTVSCTIRDKLELARDLARHRNPSGALETLLEMALDVLIEDMSRKKLGKTARRQATKASDAAVRPPSPSPSPSSSSSPQVQATASARDVPRHLRREAVGRDGVQCAYVSPDGRRCASRCFLEFDHVAPVALGGQSRSGNVRVLCRSHNRLAAEEAFGKQHVDSAIRAARQARSRTGHARQSRGEGASDGA